MPRPRACQEDFRLCESTMQQPPYPQQGGEDAEVCSETLQVTSCLRLVRAALRTTEGLRAMIQPYGCSCTNLSYTPWLIAQSAGNRRRGPDRKLVRNLGKGFNRDTLHSMQWLLWHSLLAFAHMSLRSSVLGAWLIDLQERATCLQRLSKGTCHGCHPVLVKSCAKLQLCLCW